MRKASWPLWCVLLLHGISPAGSRESAFSARQISMDGVDVVRLDDSVRGIEVSILPSIGNMAYEMKIHGKNILISPHGKLSDFQNKPMQMGIPFLAPWANRMDGTGFWANGKRYDFDMALGNVFRDARGLPIHGLLVASAFWQVTDIAADLESARVTSKFEFWKYPDLMKQWPLAHEYEMTYRLADGALEVKTTITNLSREAMPVAIGFHPYCRIPEVPRDQWLLRMPAGKAVLADDRKIPTGELKPSGLPSPLPLRGRVLDDGYAELERDENGRALFSIEAGEQRIEVLFGPRYPVAVIWEPASFPEQALDFICIEPMAGITNAINLNHAGKYPGLQTVPVGGKWTESFWIRTKGF